MTVRNDFYLRHVRAYVSCISWERDSVFGFTTPIRFDDIDGAEPTIAHHVRIGHSGGMGKKPSDYRCVPLTDMQHKTLHQMGEASFWAHHRIDPFQVIAIILAAYVGAASQEVMGSAGMNDGHDLVRALEAVLAKRAPTPVRRAR